MENNQLYHYGVLGMRWGVRRSEAQLARARGSSKKSSSSDADAEKKKSMKQDVKNRRLLSTDDLKKKIERIKLEKELKNLTDEEISRGKKAASDILESSGRKIATTIITGATLYAIKAAMTGKIDMSDAAGYVVPKPKNK